MTFIFLTNVNSVLLITHWHGYTAGYNRWEASPNLWTLVQVMVWCHHTTIHYLNQCWPWLTKQCSSTRLKLLTMLAIIMFTEFKSGGFLIHCGPVMPYGIMIGLTLVQIMACFQTAPSHYMNQCGLIISEILWHPLLTVGELGSGVTGFATIYATGSHRFVLRVRNDERD